MRVEISLINNFFNCREKTKKSRTSGSLSIPEAEAIYEKLDKYLNLLLDNKNVEIQVVETPEKQTKV